MSRGYAVNWYRSTTPIVYAPDLDHHCCEALSDQNRLRQLQDENSMYIFKDFDTGEWSMKIGYEFASIRYCSFCGEMLCLP